MTAAHFKIGNQSRHCISAKKGRRGNATRKLVMVEFSVMGPAESSKSRTLGTPYLSVFCDSSPKVAGVQRMASNRCDPAESRKGVQGLLR